MGTYSCMHQSRFKPTVPAAYRGSTDVELMRT